MAYRKFWVEDSEAIPAYKFEVTQPTGYTEVTDSTELCKLFIDKYKERETDGQEFYNGFRSQLNIEVINGEITPTEAFLVEVHLKDLADQLNTGNWLTAQNTSTNKALSGIYDQDLKDEIQAGIDQYVTDNY